VLIAKWGNKSGNIFLFLQFENNVSEKMKIILHSKLKQGAQFLLILFPVICCKGQATDSLAAKILFEKDTIYYGTVPLNSNPYRILKFTNTGKEPLLIQQVMGDIVQAVEYPKYPVLAGQSGEIKVFYPTEKIGPFINFIAITSNVSSQPKIIFVKGNILP
jgi:hypothetical protein